MPPRNRRGKIASNFSLIASKAFLEAQPADAVQFDDGLLQVGDGFFQIFLLLAHELEACGQLFVLADGGEIYFAHAFQAAAQIFDVEQQLIARRAFLAGVGGQRLQVGVVFFAQVVGKMLQVEPLFGERELNPAALFLAGYRPAGRSSLIVSPISASCMEIAR